MPTFLRNLGLGSAQSAHSNLPITRHLKKDLEARPLQKDNFVNTSIRPDYGQDSVVISPPTEAPSLRARGKEGKMSKRKNPLVFMDVSIDGDPIERMIFELFYDVAPKTAENFRALCTGEKGIGPKTGKPLHYKGSFFHRIGKGSMAQGGDFVKRDGTVGESIYGVKFPDELPRLKHEEAGLLSMSMADRDNLGSHFIITFKANLNLDRKFIVFGKLVQGLDVLKKMEVVGDADGLPTVTVKIINCGELNDDKKKMNKSKMRKDASPKNVEVKRKRKQKKSYRDNKRRRKYHTSESESSSDSEFESSESDSDSDSDLSLSSDDTSSSDDRHKKRKRSSKRDRHRHGRRKNKQREKKRQQRDKHSKRRSKRALDSTSDSESESKSGSSLASDGVDVHGTNEKHKESSVKVADNGAFPVLNVHHRRKEGAAFLINDEGRTLQENGQQKSNGIAALDSRSDRWTERQPDIVDDHPGKSRSRSLSPKRSMSKSMSISSKKSFSKSPSVSPKQSMSRSNSVSKSPHVPQRNRNAIKSPFGSDSSKSPVRSLSRSPPRGIRKGRRVSGSPARAKSLRGIGRGPSLSRSPPRKTLRKSVSRSPIRASRSVSRSSVRSAQKSVSRSSGRQLPSRRISRSPIRPKSYSRSPSPVQRPRSPLSDRGKSGSRSVSPGDPPKHIRRGRGFSQRYSYARRYRTPSTSLVRSYRFSGRPDRERYYSSYRKYSSRRYRSPPRGRSPLRYRTRRSKSPTVSHSPRFRSRRYSRSRSPIRSRSPVKAPGYHASPRIERRRSPSRSESPSQSLDSHSPKRTSKTKSKSRSRSRSRSSSRSPAGKKGLVSYGDGSPDSSER